MWLGVEFHLEYEQVLEAGDGNSVSKFDTAEPHT